MSVTWQAWLYCDGAADCQYRNEVWFPGEGARSPAEQRRSLKLAGWRSYGGKDYCPECASEHARSDVSPQT